MSYGQGIFPTSNYPSWGLTTGYNFDPMMGQPLRPSIPCSYPFLLQSPETLLSTSLNPSLVDLLALLDADDDESPPLIVEPPAHSSHMVMGGMVPYNHLLICSRDNSISLTQVKPQGKHLFCQCSRKGCVKGDPTPSTHFSKYCIG